MAKSVPWDIYEAAILLDGTEKVHQGRIDRKQAISEVSKMLREKARLADLEIDDDFRSIAGISFQMLSMESALAGYTIVKPASKLFTEIVKTKEENISEYSIILQEAFKLAGENLSLEEEYVKWLFPKVNRFQISDLYLTYSLINKIYLDKGLLLEPLFETKDLNLLLSIKKSVKDENGSKSEFVKNRKMTLAMQYYISFIEEYNDENDYKNEESFDHSTEYENRNGQEIGAQKCEVESDGCIDDLPRIESSTIGEEVATEVDNQIVPEVKCKENIDEIENISENENINDEECEEGAKKPLSDNNVKEIKNDFIIEQKKLEFREWLVSKGTANLYSAQVYLSSFELCEKIAKKNGIIKTNIFEICSVDEMREILYKLMWITEFQERNRSQYNRCKSSFEKYIDFLQDTAIQDSKDVTDICDSKSDSGSNEPYIALDSENNIKEKNPILYRRLKSMASVYDDVNGFEIDWIKSCLSLSINIDELKEALDEIPWITKIKEGFYSFSKNTERHTGFDNEAFTRVLMARYQNGMKLDSIDLENFRETYNDIIGEEITLSDKDLEICLRKSGILYKDRIFPAEGIINIEASKKLMEYVKQNFENGNKVLYYKAIYSDLSDVFAYCFNLTDEQMLKSYLEYICEPGEYYFTEEYISKEKNIKVNHVTEIENYMMMIGKPLSYEELYAGLSHISREIVYSAIKTNPEILLNEKEHYFHIGIFELSTEEADKITEYIKKEIDEEGYCIWSHIFSVIQSEMPLFIENNAYLSSLGIRNAIAKKLTGRFSFDGEVICNRGEFLNMAAVYQLYGEHHAPFSDNDIYEFSKEISGGSIYFDSLSRSTVRVSKQLFVSRKQIEFDVEATDKAISTFFSKNYIPVKEIDSFLVFPNVGYEWNSFLLESYLMYFSSQFMLVNNGRSLGNVAGAVVKKGNEYNDFVNVCADVLANSDCVLTKDKALEYLADLNFLTRRSYSKIDDAISKAKQIRNKRG